MSRTAARPGPGRRPPPRAARPAEAPRDGLALRGVHRPVLAGRPEVGKGRHPPRVLLERGDELAQEAGLPGVVVVEDGDVAAAGGAQRRGDAQRDPEPPGVGPVVRVGAPEPLDDAPDLGGGRVVGDDHLQVAEALRVDAVQGAPQELRPVIDVTITDTTGSLGRSPIHTLPTKYAFLHGAPLAEHDRRK